MGRPGLSAFEKKVRSQISMNLKNLTKGMTQREISEKTNIPASTLSGYFNETSTITPENLKILAEFFNVERREIDPRFLNMPEELALKVEQIIKDAGDQFRNGELESETFQKPTSIMKVTITDSVQTPTKYSTVSFEISFSFNENQLLDRQGSIGINLEISSPVETKYFPLECAYSWLNRKENGGSALVEISKIYPDGWDKSKKHYDEYLKEIEEFLYRTILVEIEKAANAYFKLMDEKPLDVSIVFIQ